MTYFRQAFELHIIHLCVRKELGATEVIDSRSVDDIVKYVKDLTGKNGGVDYAVDYSGVPNVIESMLDMLAM